MDESVEQLTGGNTHASIERIGGKVRRPTGHWTPGIHAVLRHLEQRGVAGVPRAIGIDEHDREILTFIEGAAVWPGHFDVLDDDGLRSVARLIRCIHDALSDFDPTPWTWHDAAADPSGVTEILCHNDLAPWNLIHDHGAWAFIDWNLAALGRRSWDLAWALLTLVPFFPEMTPPEDRVRESPP